MQLLHKYNMACLWPAYAKLLGSTFSSSHTQTGTGTDVLLVFLATSRLLSLKHVEQVAIAAIENKLKTVRLLGEHVLCAEGLFHNLLRCARSQVPCMPLGANSILDDLEQWLRSRTCVPSCCR